MHARDAVRGRPSLHPHLHRGVPGCLCQGAQGPPCAWGLLLSSGRVLRRKSEKMLHYLTNIIQSSLKNQQLNLDAHFNVSDLIFHFRSSFFLIDFVFSKMFMIVTVNKHIIDSLVSKKRFSQIVGRFLFLLHISAKSGPVLFGNLKKLWCLAKRKLNILNFLLF